MIVNGACKFCKQVAITNAETEEEAIYQATMACDCISAMRYRERQTKAIEAMAQMEEMYHAENAPETVISLMNANIKEMAEGNLAKAQYILPNGKKLTVTARDQKFTVETSQAEKKEGEGMSKYGAKREYIKEKGYYMYGIYKDGQIYDNCYLYGRENAKLVVELLTLIDKYIIDHDNGMFQIMQILRIDRERGKKWQS